MTKKPIFLPLVLCFVAAACTVPNPNYRPRDAAPDPTAKELTSLVFLASNNPGLAADVPAVIDGTTVKASVPFGRNRALVATFTTTGARIEVAGAAQESGVTKNDFLVPVTYHVVAGDGSTQDYTVTAGPAQQAYIKASNTDPSDYFGGSVALSADGNTLAIGAAQESSKAGINGDQTDNTASLSGAVYVSVRSGGVWSQQAYLKASNTGAGDTFGHSVALSADGATLAVGASQEGSKATGINGDQGDNSVEGSGAVYVFTRSGVVWSQQAYVKSSNTVLYDSFGFSVGLSPDGNTLAVGATGSGTVCVFARSGAVWSQQAYLKAAGFGHSVALSAGGNTLAVGAPNFSGLDSGAVYVFARSGTNWSQQAVVKEAGLSLDDAFGSSVALSADGNTLAVGAFQDGNSGGAVYAFTRSGTGWSQEAYLKASNADPGDRFGGTLALSADGNTLAVGAAYESSAAKGIGGNQADKSADASGAVYVLTRSSSVWSQQSYVKASNPDSGDFFGTVALSGDGVTLAVGSSEDSLARGVNDNNYQSDNSKPSSGAVYVFH